MRSIIEESANSINIGRLNASSSGWQKMIGRGFMVMLGFLLALSALQAQSSSFGKSEQAKASGSIAGTVKDPQKLVVSGALVTLTDQATNQTQTTHSDDQGVYRFSNLKAAAYTVEVSVKGFKTEKITDVQVSEHTAAVQDIALLMGQSSHVVEVTANRDFDAIASPTVAALPESVQIQSTVLTSEEIESLHPQTVWDAIQQLPGMEVTYQGRQHLDFTYMRGESFRIILDGIYLSQTDRLLASLPASIIESMTVIDDASALSLGPLTSFGGARGASNQGFIVIKTKRATKLSGGLTARVGTYSDIDGTIYQGDKIGRFDYNLAVSYNNYAGKDNWFNASQNKGVAFRTGFSLWGFNADALYYASRGMREMQWGEILLPTVNKNGTYNYSQVGTIPPNAMSMPYMFSSMVGVNVTKPWSDSQTTTFQYAYNLLDVDTRGSSYTDASPQNSREIDYNLRHAIKFGNNSLSFGSQFLKYYAPTGVAPTNLGQKEGMLGLYIQDEQQLFADKLIIDGGIRSDKKYYYNSPNSGKPLGEWAKATYTLSFGALYKASSLVNFRTRLGYSESGLSADQVSATGQTLPPEKRFRFQFGVIGNVRSYFKPSITVFLNDVANEKTTSSYTTDPATGDDITYVTAADTVTRGSELAISGKIGDSWNYSASYTYWISDNATKNLSNSRQLVSARLGYRHKIFFANISTSYAGPKYYSNSPAGLAILPMADYDRVDANGGFDFKLMNRATKLSFYGRNLGNNHYFTRYVTGAYKDVGLQYGMDLSISFF